MSVKNFKKKQLYLYFKYLKPTNNKSYQLNKSFADELVEMQSWKISSLLQYYLQHSILFFDVAFINEFIKGVLEVVNC